MVLLKLDQQQIISKLKVEDNTTAHYLVRVIYFQVLSCTFLISSNNRVFMKNQNERPTLYINFLAHNYNNSTLIAMSTHCAGLPRQLVFLCYSDVVT